MAEWPEEKLLGREGPDGPLLNPDEMFHSGDPKETVETETYVPRQKLEEVERKRDQLRDILHGAAECEDDWKAERDRADQLQAILDALVGEEALVALRDALRQAPGGAVSGWRPASAWPDDPRPRRYLYVQAVEAALQAAKKQAGEEGDDEPSQAERRQSVAQLLADALKNTEEVGRASIDPVLKGLRLLSAGETLTTAAEEELCREILEAGWYIAPAVDPGKQAGGGGE